MLDLVHVRSFIAVATELHFSRAAGKLGLSQPPLSRHIRMLEEYLGVRLLERSRHGVALTGQGQVFLAEARQLLARAETAEMSVRGRPQEPEGTVRLGFYGAAAFRLLPRVIMALNQRHPRIRLDLRELDGAGQRDAFAFGRLDLGLVRPSAHPTTLTAEVVLAERLLLALRADHPLARRKKVRLTDIDGLPFVGYSSDAPYMHDLVRRVLAAQSVMPDTVQSVAQAQAILSLVGAGLGAALLPEHARHAGREGVVFLPLFPAMDMALTHLVRAETPQRPIVGLVRDVIRETGAALETEREAT